MSQHQDAIYANDRIDLILPYGKIDEEFYQQIIAPYEPTVINDQFVVIHIPIRPNELLENIRFVYSLVPNLYVPLDTTSLEVSGILQTQNQPGLNLHGKMCYWDLWIRESIIRIRLFYQQMDRRGSWKSGIRQYPLPPGTDLSGMEPSIRQNRSRRQ